MSSDHIKEVIESLSPQQFEEVKAGLLRKVRRDAADIAGPMGSALAANLRVLGMHEEEAAVNEITKRVYERKY